MSKKLSLALIGAMLLSALAACTSAAPESAPTATTEPSATLEPTAAVQPTASSDQAAVAQLTEEDQAYTLWLAVMQSGLERTVSALIGLWQSTQDAESEPPSADMIADMEELEGLVQDYVEKVEERENVPTSMTQIHTALLDQVQHWEVGASLLVESAKALRDGDQEQFEAKAEQAGEAVRAAGAAREELMKAREAMLGQTEEEGSD